MIKIILTALVIIAIIVLVVYLVKTSERISKFEDDYTASGSDAKPMKRFAWDNRLFVLGTLTTLLLSAGIVGNTAYMANREQVVIRDSVQLTADSVCFNRMESLDKENILIAAICEVESGDNPDCKGGGCMQITKVCVDAANRLQKKQHYDYEDRYSRDKSVEIWHIIQNNCNKTGDIEKAIRLWNGGPSYTKAGTQGYYEKVMRVYNRKIDEHLEDICRQYKSLSF